MRLHLPHRLIALLALASFALAHAAAEWDVIVIGSEPEAIAAAIAASEEGARTLLITRDERLGGLFVRGELNVLDLRLTPTDYQLGLFDRWWRRVGRFTSFDVARAERAFEQMLDAAEVSVLRGVDAALPHLEGDRVVGVVVAGETLRAAVVIDGTGDADFAAAAGARSSWGFEAVGFDARMADTLVFAIEGVDWTALRRGIRERGRNYAHADDWVAYGHFGGHPAAYRPIEPGLRLRGLNLGRQEDDSVLVNALLIYGIDPFDPASRAEGRARAEAEIPRIIAWLARDVPGFANARPGRSADDLYVRQTRHLQAHCILTIDDVLDHVVTESDVAAGGYPLDVQTLTPNDSGFVFGMPEIYGGRLCMTVPIGVEGLMVVGRSSGYDPLAQSSARVVPFGMAMAEAAGVAAAWAVASDLSPAEVASDDDAIDGVRERLLARGAYLPTVADRKPAGPIDHPLYDDYRAMLRWGLAVGGYGNDPGLDQEVPATSLLYLLANIGPRAAREAASGMRLVQRFGHPIGALTPELAAAHLGAFLEILTLPDLPWAGRTATPADVAAFGAPLDARGPLRRGEVYALGAFVLDLLGARMPGARLDAARD
jgi:hypothetical protein